MALAEKNSRELQWIVHGVVSLVVGLRRAGVIFFGLTNFVIAYLILGS